MAIKRNYCSCYISITFVSMSRRTSLATGDEIRKAIGPTGDLFSGWDSSIASNKSVLFTFVDIA